MAFVLIAGLLFLKAKLFYSVRSRRSTSIIFLFALAMCVPLCGWSIYGGDTTIPRGCYWIGGPIMVLTVPFLSLLIDYVTNRQIRLRWYLLRLALELFVAAPVWLIVCQLIQMILGLTPPL